MAGPRHGCDTMMQRTGSGTPVVLIHGIQASGTVWARVIEPLVAGGHEVLVPVLAGHRGGPPLAAGADASLATLADDLESQLDDVGIGAAHLVGNSLRGWLALELAHRGCSSSALALSPGGGWSSERDLIRVVRLLRTGRPTLLRHRERIVGMMSRPRARRLGLRIAMQHGDRISVREVDELLRDFEGCEAFDRFGDWVETQQPLPPGSLATDCPVLVAWGAHDRTTPFRRYGPRLLSAVPSAEHITLRGVGHIPMLDDPDLIARTILEFTARIDTQGALQPCPSRQPLPT